MEAVCCVCRMRYLKSSFFKAGRDSVFGNQSSFLDFCLFLLSGPQKVDDFLLESFIWSSCVGSAMNMWLYIGIRAEFINSALWRRSVGGVVASILLFIRLASVFLIVSSIVLSIVFPRKIPRCLQISGVSIPFWFRWGVYAQGCSFSDVDVKATYHCVLIV
jgi:hypothetical protein